MYCICVYTILYIIYIVCMVSLKQMKMYLLGWNTELISVGFFYKGWAIPDEGAESDQRGPHHLCVCSLLRPFLSITPNQHVHPSTSSLSRPGFCAESRPQTPSRCRKESDGGWGHHLWDIRLNRYGNDGQIRSFFWCGLKHCHWDVCSNWDHDKGEDNGTFYFEVEENVLSFMKQNNIVY